MRGGADRRGGDIGRCASRPIRSGAPAPRPVVTIGLAWLLSLGFDFFLHGGLLAALYLEPNGFLLETGESLRRIPLGYLALLILTIGLYWLFVQGGVTGWFRGFRLALAGGLVVQGGEYLGLYSITTAEPGLLLAWWVGQAFELGLGGAVIGTMLGGSPTRNVVIKVLVAIAVMVTATLILQSLHIVPTPEGLTALGADPRGTSLR